MNAILEPDERWKLVGGRLCLDFANTVGGRNGTTVTRDDLPDYDSLVRWGAFASVVEASERSRLREEGRRSAFAAGSVHRRAVRLRESIQRIGEALVGGATPSRADLRVLDREVREARRQQHLSHRGRRVRAEWIRRALRLDRILWPVALDAAAVFGSSDVDRLKRCGGADCGWLFLDSTRNHSRQWCDMADCGNVAKVRRFRQRRRRLRRER